MTHITEDERLASILGEIAYKDWSFHVGKDGIGLYHLQVKFRADGGEWSGRKWRLSQHMTRSEVVQTALTAVLAAEEHEAREKFLFRGQAIYGPHFDCVKLWQLAAGGDAALDVRVAQ